MKLGTSCKVCLSYWDVGIVYCTCGHFLRNGTEENKKFVQYTMDFLSIPNYYIKKGRPHGHRYGKKPGITSTTSRIRSRRNARRSSTWVSTTGSYETRSSAKTCLTPVARRKCVARWTKLANEDHTHHLTPEEIRGYRANWWIRSNKVGSDTMPVRHRPDFKQALSTLRQLKDKEDAAHQQRWTQSYSSSWWNWQESWWHSSYEHHHEDVPSTD